MAGAAGVSGYRVLDSGRGVGKHACTCVLERICDVSGCIHVITMQWTKKLMAQCILGIILSFGQEKSLMSSLISKRSMQSSADTESMTILNV